MIDVVDNSNQQKALAAVAVMKDFTDLSYENQAQFQ